MQLSRMFVFTLTQTQGTFSDYVCSGLWRLFLRFPRRNKECRYYLYPAIISFKSAENIFTGTRTQGSSFGFVTFAPSVSSPKQIMLVFSMFVYCHSFTRYRKLHRNLNPGQFFGVVAFVPANSLLKQTTLVLAPFFYLA
jgi:hypothetical protein